MKDINIGKKISEFRKLKNLTIKELAEFSGVTSSLLSQIERGLANPSINTVKLISQALNIPVFQLFLQDIDTKDLVVRAKNRKKIIFPESKNFSYELLSPDLSGSIEFVLMKLTSNSHSSKEVMGHDGEEAAVVIKGKIKFYLEEDEYILNTGDSVTIPPFTKHKWENIFDEEASIIFAINPPVF